MFGARFGLARFGLARFGLPGEYRLPIAGVLAADARVRAGAGKSLRYAPGLGEDVRGSARALADAPVRLQGGEGVYAAVWAGKASALTCAVADTVLARVCGAKNIGIHDGPGGVRGVHCNRFGLTRFGLPGGEALVNARINLSERLALLAGAGKNLPAVSGAGAFSASVLMRADAAGGCPILARGQAVILSAARLNLDVHFLPAPRERVLGRLGAVKELELCAPVSESVWGDAYLGKDLRLRACPAGEWAVSIGAVKDVRGWARVSEIVGASVSSWALEYETARVDVTLPPGGVLVIDSDNYEVYLDGRRILHLQRGDWIFPDRRLVDLTVDSGTGGALRGTILYNERYL